MGRPYLRSNLPSVKDLVKDGKRVAFVYYRSMELWYQTEEDEGGNSLTFPVPVEDTGTGLFMSSDKAITFMRYIRKHLEKLKEGE